MGKSLPELDAKTTAVVVGAGPAGVCAVANLLDAEGTTSVVWIDESFEGGRLSHYKEVPSNTKVALFVRFAEASPTLAKLLKDHGDGPDTPISELRALDQQAGCTLQHAWKLVRWLGELLRQHCANRVSAIVGRVTSIDMEHQDDGESLVTINSNEEDGGERQIRCGKVLLCTGSQPRVETTIAASLPPHTHTVPLDTALTPSLLQHAVCADDTVAVVGSSHSAVLVLKNLAELQPASQRPGAVLNVYRNDLRYAVYMPDDWILYDNTGLKGVAADWARKHIDTGASNLTRVRVAAAGAGATAADYARTLAGVTKIIYAVGYDRSALPQLRVCGKHVDAGDISYDAATGQLRAGSKQIANLYGFGIAFPEQVTDRAGNVEWSVGMWKFMRYMKRAIAAIAV